MNKIIKIQIAFFIAMFAVINAQAQETKQFFVGDLKVIYKQTPKEVISVRMYVRGGTANYTKEQEGIENLAFNLAMNGGTKKMDKVTFNNEAEKIGTRFGSASGLDLGNLSMTCLKPFWDKSWSLFSDALMTPAFDQKEFNLVKDKMTSAAKNNESNPDAYLNDLTMTTAFEGRSYAKLPTGTVASIAKITLDDVKKYYSATVCRKRCYLVVVGNVTEAELTEKIKSTILNMPIGTMASKEAAMPITKTSVKIVDRDIATNYLQGVMNSPQIGTPEGIPMQLAMNILYDRYFVELRTKRSLSYAPAAFYNASAITNPFSMVYITTVKPKDALAAMVMIIDSARNAGFTEKELKDKKQTFLTRNYMKLETSDALSAALGRAEAINNFKFEDTYTDKVNTTSLKEINDTFKKYTNAIKWIYLGKQSQIAESDFPQPKPLPVGNGPH